MTQPSQSALSKQSVHSGKTSTIQDISVGYFILPAYSQDTADASQVECVESSLLPGIHPVYPENLYIFDMEPMPSIRLTDVLKTCSRNKLLVVN